MPAVVGKVVEDHLKKFIEKQRRKEAEMLLFYLQRFVTMKEKEKNGCITKGRLTLLFIYDLIEYYHEDYLIVYIGK